MADAADRSLPATPRRREEARRAGLMPTATAPAWAAGAATALALAPAWGRSTLPAAAEMLQQAIRAATAPQAAEPGLSALLPAAVLLPTVGLVLASAAVGLVVRLALDGLTWQPARAVPDLRRIDPLAGLRRIFSSATLAAAVGNGLGLALLVAAAVLACGPLLSIVATPDALPEGPQAWAAARRPILAVAAAAVLVAACQWGLARRRFERRIRMTPQEFADEARSMQADPKIRLLHQQRSRQPARGGS